MASCDFVKRMAQVAIDVWPIQVAEDPKPIFKLPDCIRSTFELSGRERQDAKSKLAKCTAYRQIGTGGVPLTFRLSEGGGIMPIASENQS